MNYPHIHVIAVAFEKFGHLKVFVQSWLLQTAKNWSLTVIHDGPNEEFVKLMTEYQLQAPDQIEFYCTDQRYNDYGHTLRDMALKTAKNDYVLLTNADNYFVPKAVEIMNWAFEASKDKMFDVLMWNMIHSHQWPGDSQMVPPYSFFETSYRRWRIDVSAAIVKTDLAKQAGFRDHSFDGDATYFEDIAKIAGPENFFVCKVPMVLFVHN